MRFGDKNGTLNLWTFEPVNAYKSLRFLNKLKDKTQDQDQQKQAAHVISIIQALFTRSESLILTKKAIIKQEQ